MSFRGRGPNYIRRSGIYQIRCKFNGKVYVGASRNLHRRWLNHQAELTRGAHPNKRLQADWDRLGPDVFVFETLEIVADSKCLLKIERDWITRLSSFKPLLGYNTSKSADVTKPFRGCVIGLAVRQIRKSKSGSRPLDKDMEDG